MCHGAAKPKQAVDVVALWGDHVLVLINDVVKAQIESFVDCEQSKNIRLSGAGVQDRNNVADVRVAEFVELIDPADHEPDWCGAHWDINRPLDLRGSHGATSGLFAYIASRDESTS
jgi:hypothetical protein